MKVFVISLLVLVLISLVGCGSSSDSNTTTSSNSNPAVNSNLVPYVPPGSNTINSNVPAIANANPPTVINPKVPAKQMTFPAPDDSEYSSTMDKSGMAIETRVFHSNPQISKVVRTWKGVNDKTISIYLKNGKVIDLPGDKIDNINSQPVSVFLDAAGIKPQSPPPAANGQQKVKPQKTP